MSTLTVEGFAWDDENEDKVAAHGLSMGVVSQVLDNPHVLAPNRRNRRGMYLLIGTDNGGGCISVPIEPTPHDGIWRPITAWRCKPGEYTVLKRRL